MDKELTLGTVVAIYHIFRAKTNKIKWWFNFKSWNLILEYLVPVIFYFKEVCFQGKQGKLHCKLHKYSSGIARVVLPLHAKMKAQYKELRNHLYQTKEKAVSKMT